MYTFMELIHGHHDDDRDDDEADIYSACYVLSKHRITYIT